MARLAFSVALVATLALAFGDDYYTTTYPATTMKVAPTEAKKDYYTTAKKVAPTEAEKDYYYTTTKKVAPTEAEKDYYYTTTKKVAPTEAKKDYYYTTAKKVAPTEAKKDYYYTTKKVAPIEEKKCTLPGSKCAGAYGYDYVPYYPCCDGPKGKKYECVEASYKGWGKYCIEVAPKCYAKYEKCMGQEGYPYYPYAPCCDEGYTCQYPTDKKKYGEWGGYCLKDEKYVKPSKELPKKIVAPKCYKDGEKCKGQDGYPYYPYAPCCSKDYVCEYKKHYAYGEWGGYCVKKVDYPEYYPTKYPMTTKKVAPTEAKKDYYYTTAKKVAPTEAKKDYYYTTAKKVAPTEAEKDYYYTTEKVAPTEAEKDYYTTMKVEATEAKKDY